MMHLLKRLLLFSVPFWLYGFFIYLTDPYNFLGGPAIISNEIKMRTAYPLNYCLWKMPEFTRHPSPNLLLGDSRMDALKPERVKELTGTDNFNLAYGGATIREIVESFWSASRHASLRHVYIGINFNLYTDYEQFDRTAEVLMIERCTACYFINRTVLRAALYGIAGQWMHYDPKIGMVSEDRETFWRNQIGPQTAAFYARYVYPRKYHAELERIARYAKENGVDLVFLIFPTHVELQNRVRDFGLEGEYARFKQDLSSLATTYDFDYPNELTANKNNFSDPYHCRHACVDEIIREVWSGHFKYGRPLSGGIRPVSTDAVPSKFSPR
jgi:hypothetical protein